MARVVVARRVGTCAIEQVDVRALGDTDVLVRIDASGICHSDVALMTGDLAGELPVALGHEGAGTVLDVGAAVTTVVPGDRVVLAAVPSCGTCHTCARGEFHLCERSRELRVPGFLDGGQPIRGASGLGTFADVLVVAERAVVAVRTDLPAEQLALLGCAVLTGAGAALRLARVEPGASVLIVGAGGVGLSAVQASRSAGATVIAVVDPSAAARTLATACGATTAVDPGDANTALPELTAGRGFDVVIECVAIASTLDLAWRLSRLGGEIVLVGVPPQSERFPMSIADVTRSGRRLTGCIYGGSSARDDIPRYVAMAESGQLDLATMIGHRVALDDVPALLLTRDFRPGRTVIVG